MRVRTVAGLAVLLASCSTPVHDGERLYREGDRLGALETWRTVPEGSEHYARARENIAALEPEFERLAVQYKERALDYEAKDRLAEAILDYRLAIELQPYDHETLDHVQQLARTLANRKAELGARYRESFDAGDLAAARSDLAELRRIDPFDSSFETESRVLTEALRAAVESRMEAGRAAFAAGKHGTAARNFRSVLALDPDHEAARGYLSYIATMQRESRPATIADADTLASDAELRAAGFHQSALAAERRGEPYAAIRYELRAIETAPDYAGSQRHLAELRKRLAGDVDSLVEAGRIAFREEDLRAALELWRRALLVDPDNERIIAYIGRAAQQLENLERLRASPGVAGGGK